MFKSRMTEYAISAPVITRDSYNYPRKSYSDEGTALVYIVVQDRSGSVENDIELYTATLVGYTEEGKIEQGWKVGDYIVESVIPHRTCNVLYLKELNDG